MHLFSDFNSLFHSIEMSLNGIIFDGIPASATMFSVKNEASENPESAWCDVTLWTIANFCADMRERGQFIRILH